MPEGMRLQKFLSRAGRASRREAERLMLAGRVTVNGAVASELGMRVTPGLDRIEVDGEAVTLSEARWVAFHKPPGVLTTRSDPHGGTTVYDVLPRELAGLTYVGRLDRDAEGLLLLTNDGDLAHTVQHPSAAVERLYRVRVAGTPGPAALALLLEGVELDDGPARARSVQLVDSDGTVSELDLVLTEGRKREVRRMLSAVGHPVLRLTRTRFGPVELGALERGAWRDLDPAERAALGTVGPRD